MLGFNKTVACIDYGYVLDLQAAGQWRKGRLMTAWKKQMEGECVRFGLSGEDEFFSVKIGIVGIIQIALFQLSLVVDGVGC